MDRTTIQTSETIQMILKGLVQEHLPAHLDSISNNSSLFADGILDSLSLIDIVEKIEQQFSIQIHWNELNLEYFDSIEKMSQFINRKKQCNR